MTTFRVFIEILDQGNIFTSSYEEIFEDKIHLKTSLRSIVTYGYYYDPVKSYYDNSENSIDFFEDENVDDSPELIIYSPHLIKKITVIKK